MWHHHNRFRGFTMAELILAMAIVSILTAAMIPMLKYYKVRQKETFVPHGIYECFYDDNGKLHSYKRDNETNVGGEYDKDISGGVCYFPIPKSNYYELHIIEPGSPGSGYSEEGRKEIFDNTDVYFEDGEDGKKTKEVAIDDSYSSSVSTLPSFVKQAWMTWDLANNNTIAQVTVTAPKGTGPTSETTETVYKRYYDSEKGDFAIRTETKTRPGTGFPNSGNTATVRFKIHPDSTITTNPPRSIKSSPITLLTHNGTKYVTGSSTMSRYDNTYGYCSGHTKTDDDSGDCGNTVTISCGDSDENFLNCGSSGSASQGVGGFAGELEFTYYENSLKYVYGLSGDNGRLTKLTYNKINAKTLQFQPAETYKDNTVVKKDNSEYIYNNGNKKIPTTKSKEHDGEYDTKLIDDTYNEYFQELIISRVTNEDLPVPDKLENFKQRLIPSESYLVKAYCKAEGSNDNGLCRQVEKGTITNYPGLAGYGGYPVITKLDVKGDITMKDADSTKQLSKSLPITVDDEFKCFSGKEPVQSNHAKGWKYCEATESGSGAVILIW